MKIMKHIKIIPMITLIVGLGLAGYMFYNIIVSPLLNAEHFYVNDVYSVNVSEEFVITIFIDEENVESIRIEDQPNFKKLTYRHNTIDYSVLLNVISENEGGGGFIVTSTNEETSYNVENLKSVFQIHFQEAGTYHFGLITYDDEPTEFKIISTNIPEAKSELYRSITIASVSFVGSMVSLYFLLKNPKKDA